LRLFILRALNESSRIRKNFAVLGTHAGPSSGEVGCTTKLGQQQDLRCGLILCILAFVAAGCGDVDEIRRYQAPKTQTSAAENTRSEINNEPAFAFETPQGWAPGERVVSRGGVTIKYDAAFIVTDEQQRLDITVNRMPAMGSFLQNVNRWRGQVGLGPVQSEELDAAVESIEIDGSAADYVELVGESETILGIVAVRGRYAWYLKLKGDAELAEREKENFETFVKSIKFN
jgi:hypothetical protein